MEEYIMPTIWSANPFTEAQARFKENMKDRKLAAKIIFKLEIADPWFIRFHRLHKKGV